MRIAIDKNSLNAIKNDGNEYIYIFNDEPLEELIKTNLHCIKYDECDYIDINLTEYKIECMKKATLKDKDYNKIPSKMNYDFVIIVPNYNNYHGSYNGKTYLENCIESILNQKYKNFKLIFVDDCSEDGSADRVKEYQKNDDRIVLIQNIRKRYNGGSRNAGIEYALSNLDFDYFCFLDSDDWWKDNKVLETINSRLNNHELMTLGCEMLGKSGVFCRTKNEAKNYEELWSLNNALWCTAWARVIRRDKIAFFCEDTLMEDRVWTYKIADKLDYNNIINLKQYVYVWNRLNTTNSVSLVRNDYWNASAYCHIGHQIQMLETIKHKEMIPVIKARIETCKNKVNNDKFEQY